MTLTPEQFDELATKEDFYDLKKEIIEIKNKTEKILITLNSLVK